LRAAAERAKDNPGETRWLEPPSSTPQESLAEAIRRGLTAQPKQLPSHFFYDAEGSRLFEQICDLPEYYLTRAETEILSQTSKDLARRLPQIRTLIELGSGSATKTEYLLRAFGADRFLRYAPIDVSRSALEESVERLECLHPEIEIWAAIAEYESGIAALEAYDLGPKLTMWLGSSIGNLRRPAAAAFLSRRRESMSHEDRMIVGIDLRKDRDVLERAYDDRQGITARFNLNLLTRINRELDGDFDLEGFAHQVHYDESLGSVQSFLESRADQTVRLSALDFEIPFEDGERIHTEDSYKYSFEEIHEIADEAGLLLEHRYLDSAKSFSLNLLAPKPGR
jgi:dimethylhistidine N-methyltransferase